MSRDYLAEAWAIVEGRTMLLAEREHLVALVKKIKELARGLDELKAMVDAMGEAAK